MRIINLVDRLDRVNFGIWNAAIATAEELKRQYGIESEIWYPEATDEARPEELKGARARGFGEPDQGTLERMALEAQLDPSGDIVVSHGCWQYPTRWGRSFKLMGYPWLAVPHGMLEPWSVRQKRIRKWFYYQAFEKRALMRADKIRAVGKPEHVSLQRTFVEKVEWIPNGVDDFPNEGIPGKKEGQQTVLFMARLHHKKGVLPLLEGWKASELRNNPAWSLKIAGPDDGEQGAMETFLANHRDITNIEFLGPVYGDQKDQLLKGSHFYILPSHSEGFPTSTLEAMLHGMIPLVSRGCNFPELFEENLGIQVEPRAESITTGLNRIAGLTREQIQRQSQRAMEYVKKNYTTARVARMQWELYLGMASNSGK